MRRVSLFRDDGSDLLAKRHRSGTLAASTANDYFPDVLYKPWFQWGFTETGVGALANPKVTAPNVRCNSANTAPCAFGT